MVAIYLPALRCGWRAGRKLNLFDSSVLGLRAEEFTCYYYKRYIRLESHGRWWQGAVARCISNANTSVSINTHRSVYEVSLLLAEHGNTTCALDNCATLTVHLTRNRELYEPPICRLLSNVL
jgi:hypothetical protein